MPIELIFSRAESASKTANAKGVVLCQKASALKYDGVFLIKCFQHLPASKHVEWCGLFD